MARSGKYDERRGVIPFFRKKESFGAAGHLSAGSTSIPE
jgi:hypothetical protein